MDCGRQLPRAPGGGDRGAADRAGLVYGRGRNGITFHVIRHTIATMLAERADIQEGMRKELMGMGACRPPRATPTSDR